MSRDPIDHLLQDRGGELVGREIVAVKADFPVAIILDDGSSIRFADPWASMILDSDGEEWSL